MWHKVSPQAFRIPYLKNWTSTWYADKKEYAWMLMVDTIIRSILKQDFKNVPVWDIVIWRKDKEVLVTIYTSKSSLVIWQSGENLSVIEEKLSKATMSLVKVTVKEVKSPELNAKIVGFNISSQIEKRMPYKKAIKQAMAKAMEKWAKWIKVKVWWRLNWAEIARKETFKEGSVPTLTIRADIDYISTRAETVYWTIWIKVWIYKWDVFKR